MSVAALGSRFVAETKGIANAVDANKAFQTFKQLCSKNGSIPPKFLTTACDFFSNCRLEDKYHHTLAQIALTICLISLGVLKTAPLDNIGKFESLLDLAKDLEQRDGVFEYLDEAVRKQSEAIMKGRASAKQRGDIAELTEEILLDRIHKVEALPLLERTSHKDTLLAYQVLSVSCFDKSDKKDRHYRIARLCVSTFFAMSNLSKDLQTTNIDHLHREMMHDIGPVLKKEPDLSRRQAIEAQSQLVHIQHRLRYLPYPKPLDALADRFKDDLAGAIGAFHTFTKLKDGKASDPSLRVLAAETSLIIYTDLLQKAMAYPMLKSLVAELIAGNESIVHECCVIATKDSQDKDILLRAAEFEIHRRTPDWKNAETYLHRYAVVINNDKDKDSDAHLQRYRVNLLIVQARNSIPDICKPEESEVKEESETQQPKTPVYTLKDIQLASDYFATRVAGDLDGETFSCILRLARLKENKRQMENEPGAPVTY